VSYALISLVSVAVADHVSFRLILLLLANSFVLLFLEHEFIFFLITGMSIVTVVVLSSSILFLSCKYECTLRNLIMNMCKS
jgi:hypothetical protein